MNWKRLVGDCVFAVALLGVVVLLLWGLSGCALAPDRINAEAQHTSHIAQHFGANRAEYGYDTLGIDVHWQRGRVGVDISEGAVLGYCGANYCEGMYGPRDVFNARVDVALWRRQ